MNRVGKRPDPRAGLTLVEVLLAIALLGAGLAVLLASVQRGLAVARSAVQFETARRLAGALELAHAIDWQEGYAPVEEGSFESPFAGYRWRREIRPAAGDEDIPLYEVTTQIFWSARAREAGETLVTLRFVPDESGGVFERTAPERPATGPGTGSGTPGTRTPVMPVPPGGRR